MAAERMLKTFAAAIFWPRIQALLPPPSDNESELLQRMRVGPDLTKSAESIDLEANAALLRKAKGMGDKPLIVLTASPTSTDPMIPPAQQQDSNRIHQELQRELLTLSTRSRQVIAAQSGHNIQREEPQLVIEAVLDVVKQVRVASNR